MCAALALSCMRSEPASPQPVEGASQEAPDRATSDEGATSHGTRAAEGSPEAAAQQQTTPRRHANQTCGVCFAHNWQDGGARGYGSETARRSLAELQALGVDAVSLTSFGWMRSATSVDIVDSRSMGASETMERVRATARHARSLGMEVSIKPHLWLGGGDWRGEIAPDPDAGGWDAWFESYRDFLLPHARLAEEVEASSFCVGVELVTATRARPDAWRALIEEVRGVYSGTLVYAANWDEVEHVTFWDALDQVGVQMFAPLRSSERPGATLNDEARRWLERYLVVARAAERPLVLTEVGVMNHEGAASEPWVWPDRRTHVPSEAGDREQAEYYRAIARTFGQHPEVAGMYWWKWFTDPETNEEGPVGFSPRGKPAEDVLEALCAP